MLVVVNRNLVSGALIGLDSDGLDPHHQQTNLANLLQFLFARLTRFSLPNFCYSLAVVIYCGENPSVSSNRLTSKPFCISVTSAAFTTSVLNLMDATGPVSRPIRRAKSSGTLYFAIPLLIVVPNAKT